MSSQSLTQNNLKTFHDKAVRFFTAYPATPKLGDLVISSNGTEIYNGTSWISLGGSGTSATLNLSKADFISAVFG